MSRDNGLMQWRIAMRDRALEWVADGSPYPSVVGTVDAIVESPIYSPANKIARIRIVLDAVRLAYAEYYGSSIPQQGGDDHDM